MISSQTYTLHIFFPMSIYWNIFFLDSLSVKFCLFSCVDSFKWYSCPKFKPWFTHSKILLKKKKVRAQAWKLMHAYNPTLERVRPANCHSCGDSLVYNSTLSPKKREGRGWKIWKFIYVRNLQTILSGNQSTLKIAPSFWFNMPQSKCLWLHCLVPAEDVFILYYGNF